MRFRSLANFVGIVVGFLNNDQTLVAAGNIFQGTSVPGPNLPNGDGNLWDIV
jgi:hypothetical protein